MGFDHFKVDQFHVGSEVHVLIFQKGHLLLQLDYLLGVLVVEFKGIVQFFETFLLL